MRTYLKEIWQRLTWNRRTTRNRRLLAMRRLLLVLEHEKQPHARNRVAWLGIDYAIPGSDRTAWCIIDDPPKSVEVRSPEEIERWHAQWRFWYEPKPACKQAQVERWNERFMGAASGIYQGSN